MNGNQTFRIRTQEDCSQEANRRDVLVYFSRFINAFTIWRDITHPKYYQ